MAFWDFSTVDLNKKVRFGLGFALVVLLASSVTSFISIVRLIEQSKMVDHTNMVRVNLERILSTLREAEGGQRGYLLTGNEQFLRGYDGVYERIMELYNHTRSLTQDNEVQQRHLDALRPLLEKRLEKMAFVISIYKTNKSIAYGNMLEGKILNDRCTNIIKRMQNEENNLLEQRTGEVEKYVNLSPIIIAASSFFALLVSIFAFYFISKDIANKEKVQEEINKHNYLLKGTSNLNDLLRGERELAKIGEKTLIFLCEFLKAQMGVLYMEENERYVLSNCYAFDNPETLPLSFQPNEGLLGQAASSRKMLLINDIPKDGLKIKSGFTSQEPVNILIIPFHLNGHSIAVMELASTNKFEGIDLEFLDRIGESIAVFINNIKAEMKTAELLKETQNQAEELEAQQEELRQINEDIRDQRDRLQASEEELRANEEELQEKNAELEEKTNELEEQYEAIRIKNLQLEDARAALQIKMDQLESVSKYKSDFLANMSHELRTPLNSILILAKILKDNRNGSLSQKETEHAAIIEKSGNDLLKLINEILDLARIESGKINLELTDIKVNEFLMEDQFMELAQEKSIHFVSNIDSEVPPSIFTDRFRVEQILKNLLSNAFKFTPEGQKIEFHIHRPEKHVILNNPDLVPAETVAFSIKDTGIGIPEEKKNLIFEAFQQADVSTTRKYGGTGLGLTISRDLAHLLGGEIQVESQIGKGSTFTLYLPEKLRKLDSEYKPSESRKETPAPSKEPALALLPHDKLHPEKNTILIIEDDFYFCNILVDYAEKKGYEVFFANTASKGLELARQKRPGAILLDVQLPDSNGWEVLKELKNDPSLKKIPVHLMSAYDKEGTKDYGQENFLSKPVTLEVLDNALGKLRNAEEKPLKRVLIVEDNENENNAVKELLLTQDVQADAALSGREALEKIRKTNYDCVILDINLPDKDGAQVLEEIRKENDLEYLPVIIYSGKELSEKEEAHFKKYANTIIIKTEYSYTRLLEEVKLFLYSIDQTLKKTESIIKKLHKSEAILASKKVLIVDDDMRNVYSLTNVLEGQGMEVLVAYDGRQAIEELKKHPETDIVLMDVMMPEMDGIEATKELRKMAQFTSLPIIAVTAKAMPGDKKRCLAAGVSDYISKPIDINKLISLMRVWLYEN